MLSDCRHASFRNLNSTDPVDVVRVKSYVDSLHTSTRIPVRVSGNKLNFVPGRIMTGLICVFRNISLSCSLIRSCMHFPVSPIYFAAFTRNLTHYSILFSWIHRILRSHYCCRQRRTGSDKPLMYGRTAVDLISVAGSLSDACRFWDFVMLYVGETGRCPAMKHSYCCLQCMCINTLYSGLANP